MYESLLLSLLHAVGGEVRRAKVQWVMMRDKEWLQGDQVERWRRHIYFVTVIW